MFRGWICVFHPLKVFVKLLADLKTDINPRNSKTPRNPRNARNPRNPKPDTPPRVFLLSRPQTNPARNRPPPPSRRRRRSLRSSPTPCGPAPQATPCPGPAGPTSGALGRARVGGAEPTFFRVARGEDQRKARCQCVFFFGGGFLGFAILRNAQRMDMGIYHRIFLAVSLPGGFHALF